MPDFKSENTAVGIRLSTRLLWCRAIICMLLGAVGVAYCTLEFNGIQSAWVAFARPLVASLFLVFAVIENGLRFLPPLSVPADVSVKSEPAPEHQGNKIQFWRRPLSLRSQLWLKHALHLGLTAVSSLLAISVVTANLSTTATLLPPETMVIPIGSLLLAGCFALLVCERMLSVRQIRPWPLQAECVGLLRTLLSLCVLVTVALAVSRFAPAIAFWVLWLASVIVLLVAVEFLLRAFAAAFVLPGKTRPSFLTQSLIAEQYRWPLHPLLLMRKKILQHFGVDIGRIQAFRLMGQIFLPVVGAMVVVGWLMSSINEIPANQRGVYERFGRPVGVLSPGLHVGLPWPFARVLTVDYGTVHELALSDNLPADGVAATVKIPDTIEGPAPQESWRLWDNTHTTDQAQVIASVIGDKQSFQIVNMDIRLIWRVGMNDTDAMNSLYQTDNLPTTIQRIARQVLTQYFAHQQLDALLNEQRASMATRLNAEIQKRLTGLNTGVELLYTRVESIHPPAGAANAYHGVQAAQIAANALIAREKGYASSLANDAQRQATTAINGAQASANELQAQANNALTRYSAEHNAWQLNPEAYINERRYQTYSKALSNTPLLILDSKLTGNNEPLLDLRQFSQPSR